MERSRRQARQAELSRELGKGEAAFSTSEVGLTRHSSASTTSTSTLSTLLGCAKVILRAPGRNSSCSRRKDSSSESISHRLDSLLTLPRSIGVSNFTVDDLKTLLKTAKIKPVVNQSEHL